MNAARAPASLPLRSIEDAATELQHLVFECAAAATDRANDLRERIWRAEARVDLLGQIAIYRHDDSGSVERINTAIKRVQSIGIDEPEQLLELVTAQLLVGEGDDAVTQALAPLSKRDTSLISPATVTVAVRYLINKGCVDEATRLLLTFLPGSLIPVELQEPFGAETVYAKPTATTNQILIDTLATCDHVHISRTSELALRRLKVWILLGLGKADEALRETEGILRQNPIDAQTLRSEVVTLVRLRQYGEALARLENLPPNAATASEMLTWRVRLLLRLGRAPEAINVAENAASSHADDIQVQLMLAEALSGVGKLRQALTLVEKMLDKYPADSSLLTAKGTLLRRIGDTRSAVDTLAKVIQDDSTNPEARIALARALADKNDFNGALAELDQVPAGHPLRGEALLERARLLNSAGQSVEALEALDNAERSGVGDTALYVIRGDVLGSLGRESEAVATYQRGLTAALDSDKKVQEFVERLVHSAQLSTDEGYYEIALDTIAPLAEKHLLTFDAMALRAELLRLTKRWHESLEQADQALTANPGNAWASATKAATLVGLSQSQEAIDLLQPIVRNNPDYSFAAFYLVLALEAVDRITEAEQELRKHFRRRADHSKYLAWIVWARASIRIELSEFQKAIDLLRRALRAHPDVDDWKALLAVAYSRRSAPKRALEIWRSVIRNYDSSDVGDWPSAEFADALRAESELPSGQAIKIYRRLVSTTVAEAVPADLAVQAWASLRLGKFDDSISRYKFAIQQATDPFTVEQFCLSVAQLLGGKNADSEATLTRVLSAVTKMSDTRRAAALVREMRYLVGLLHRDPSLQDASAMLAKLCERLPAIGTEAGAEADRIRTEE